MSQSDRVRIAVVGCGAVAGAHLPLVDLSPHAEATVLVDKSLDRAKELAATHDVSTVLEDYNDIVGKADAAIVALPHFLHAPVSIDLLQKGIHVLVEKPMALNSADCDKMIEAAKSSGSILAVGHLRRFFHSSRFVKRAIETGLLGKIQSVDAREGSIYNWPAASDFTFRKESGGGVLSDQGAHTLDTILWWLGDYESVEYRDDAEGGVDADCEIRLKFKNGAEGFVELSRTREMRGTVIIRGDAGTLEVESKFDSFVRISLDGEETLLDGKCMTAAEPTEDVNDIFGRQLANFVDAVRLKQQPLVSGEEARRAVACLEDCRKVRQPLEFAWR